MFFDIIVHDIDFYFIFNVSIPSTLKKIDFVMHWPQCSFDFKLKTNKQKTTFLCLHQELYWTIYSLVCSTTFCHFLRQLHNYIFPKLLTFLNKELFQVPITVFQEIEIFSIKKFCKDRDKWTSIQMCNVWWICWMNQNFPVRSMCCYISLMEDYAFYV